MKYEDLLVGAAHHALISFITKIEWTMNKQQLENLLVFIEQIKREDKEEPYALFLETVVEYVSDRIKNYSNPNR